MNCNECGHENRESARFCEACAAPLVRTCTQCETELRPQAKFCDSCAHPVDAVAADAPSPAPLSYTPKHLAEKILQSKSALEGERKQITVMFADVKGSMDLAGRLDPEEWHGILDRFFEILGEGVHRFEGTVNQYTGDGIMALFGAPVAHEDHAQRACHAALYLRDALGGFADEVRESHGVEFSTRIGLNSGEVVVGKIGDDLRMDYTAQGLTVGLAQRMEGLAQDGRPHLTEYTAKWVEGFFEFEDLGTFNVKGVPDPMPVYALVGQGAARNRVERLDGAGLSPFIGRDLEMETLTAAYAEAEAGRGQVIGIVADPGLGKSRLVREFSQYVVDQGGYTITVHNPSHGKNAALSGYMTAMRDEFRVDPRDSSDVARKKIKQRFLDTYSNCMEFCPFMCDFLGAPDPDHPIPPMTAEQRQQRLLEFEKQNLQERTQTEFTVIILEDLHWADSVSLLLYDAQVRWTPGNRQMFVCTYRPEFSPPWISMSFYRQLPLPPLQDAANHSLIRDLLGSELGESELAGMIQARCGGVPFFIEETIQSLAESGTLIGERGAYFTDRPVDQVPVPATVQSVLEARIDRLGDDEKRVIQTASIIGRKFSGTILQAVVELDVSRTESAIRTLKNSEFIFEEAHYPEIEYSFKHALTQDAALGSQLFSRRQRLHSAVAVALEEFHRDRLDENAALIADHLEEAGEKRKAAEWHSRAAEWTTENDWAQGNWHWRRVLELTDDLPESQERDRLRLRAFQAFFTTGWRLGLGTKEVSPLFDEARRLFQSQGDREREVQLVASWAIFFGHEGDARRYYELSAEACASLDDSMSAETRAQAHAYAIYSAYCLAFFSEALQHAELTIQFSEGDHSLGLDTAGFPFWSHGWRFRAQILSDMGRFKEARASLEKTLEILRSEPRSEVNTWTMSDRVRMALMEGLVSPFDREDLVPLALEEHDYAERVGSDFSGVISLTNRCVAHILAGDWECAVELGRETLNLAGESGMMLQEKGYVYGYVAWALRGAGKSKEAIETAAEGVAWSELHGLAHQEAFCRIERVGALRESEGVNAVGQIERDLNRVEQIVEKTDGRSLYPRMMEERARLEGLRGRQLHPGLEQALAVYREMGADGHAQRIAAELAGVSV